MDEIIDNTEKSKNIELKEIISDLEQIFIQLDNVREKYQKFIKTETEATVADSERVKNILKKYSQLK